MTEPDGSAPSSRLIGAKILVVEDESMIAMLIEEMMTDLGCGTVWHASGTRDATGILREQRPDIVLLDVNLPGEPGYSLAAQLQVTQIPFIFVTGYGQRGLPAEWAGRPVIEKPFKLAVLARRLEEVLRAKPN
jgi:DNA-binding response OmpR family regulator